jgi:hypothetical protein
MKMPGDQIFTGWSDWYGHLPAGNPIIFTVDDTDPADDVVVTSSTSGSPTLRGGSPGISASPSYQNITWNFSNSTVTTTASAWQTPDPVVKSDIRYVIVNEDGTTLELAEQAMMTPREMLNLCKFISMVQMSECEAQPLVIKWSQLIEKLNIGRHFKAGKEDYTDYDDSGEIFYLYLFDEV